MFGKKETKPMTMDDLIVYESENLLALGLGDTDYSYKELFTYIDSLIQKGYKVLFSDNGFASDHCICFQKPKEMKN